MYNRTSYTDQNDHIISIEQMFILRETAASNTPSNVHVHIMIYIQ